MALSRARGARTARPERRVTQPHVHNGGVIMRMRMGVPMLVALVGLLGTVQAARASHCGAGKYDCCSQPCCEAQSCFSSCQTQCQPCYKLVYDTVLEKRWHTCYQNVTETVMKPVCKTCYREECKTCYKTVKETCYHTVQETCQRPVKQTCMKECVEYVCKPVCTMKTVQKKCGEWVTETYCVPGKTKTVWQKTCEECCFDPCTCQTVKKPGHWEKCKVQCPAETKCRKVWREHTVCEQVPCTTYVKERVCKQVPTTVCKKVPYTVVKQDRKSVV